MRVLKYAHLKDGGKMRTGVRGMGSCGMCGGSAFLRGSQMNVAPPSGMGLQSLAKLDLIPSGMKRNKLKKISF